MISQDVFGERSRATLAHAINIGRDNSTGEKSGQMANTPLYCGVQSDKSTTSADRRHNLACLIPQLQYDLVFQRIDRGHTEVGSGVRAANPVGSRFLRPGPRVIQRAGGYFYDLASRRDGQLVNSTAVPITG